MKKAFLIISVLIFLLGCIIAYQNIIYNDKKLHIVVCDVGQGDAIFIRTPSGSDILIDGGPDDSISSCLSRHMPFWDKTIEVVIMTHPDADHSTGLISVLRRYNVRQFYASRILTNTSAYAHLLEVLQEASVKINYVWQGDRFIFKDGLIMTTLWPTHGWADQNTFTETDTEINNFSVVEFLNYKNFKALFTGDIEALVIKKIDLMIGEIDFLKIPHHGSKAGLTLDILNILNPKIAAISVGRNNKYGHPTIFILDLLKSKNIKTLRTDEVGDIEIISDGHSFRQKIN